MGKDSKIEWCQHTFNHVRGCTKISDGCKFCYADKLSERNPGTLGVWGKNGTRVVAAESYWKEPVKWNQWAKEGTCYHCAGRGAIRDQKTKEFSLCIECDGKGEGEPYRARVFCASLADVFEADYTMPEGSRQIVFQARRRLLYTIRATSHLDWLLLTKRPENILPSLHQQLSAGCWCGDTCMPDAIKSWLNGEPWHNVWLGTSVENQEVADTRIPALLGVPAAVRFLSCEPLLGPVDLSRWLDPTGITCMDVCPDSHYVNMDDVETHWRTNEVIPICPHCGLDASWTGYDSGIDWVICGGESGPKARPMHPGWVRDIRDQCEFSQIPFLFKQHGEFLPESEMEEHEAFALSTQNEKWHRWPDGTASVRVGKKAAGRELDGRTWDQFPEVAEVAA